jgi:uncharacterized protein YkuJ
VSIESKRDFKDKERNLIMEHIQSSFVHPNTGQKMYVLEKLTYDNNNYKNHVWVINKELSIIQVDYYMENNSFNSKDIRNNTKYNGDGTGGR